VLGLDPIVAVAHPDNRGSRRVLEKLGFVSEGLRRHYGHDLVFYRLGHELG
jgi:RimJ/RimL family protein N-acetyltransferase